MSIAVSAVVRPSRILLGMVSAMCLCVIVIAVLVGCNYFDALSLWQRLLLTSAYLVLAMACWSTFFFSQRLYFIAISSAGQIRLLEISASSDNKLEGFSANGTDWRDVSLAADSTLWAKLLLLRLRSDDGRLTVLPIFPDSVSAQSFRALSVACRWIAVRGDGNKNENS